MDLFFLYFAFLNCIAHLCAFIPYRDKTIGYNLDLIGIKKDEQTTIKFRCKKLFYLNAFIALHQRFLINTDLLAKYYPDFQSPAEFKEDVRLKKVVIVMPHFGIFYDFASINYLTGYSLALVYKVVHTWIKDIIFSSDAYKNKIIPLYLRNYKQYLRNLKNGNPTIDGCDAIVVLCDQKGGRVPVQYLGQPVLWHSSPVDIHKQTKRAIWAYFCHYDFQKQQFRPTFIPIVRQYNPETSIADISQKMADVFTEAIRAQPEQYFWLHNRFQQNEPDLNRFDKIYS
jgi:lauroyl/myristoyl acyltransferase